MTDRDRIMEALQHVRFALIALKAGAPIKPALLCAEEVLLPMLFTESEVREYLTEGNAVIGRQPQLWR